MQFVEYAPKYLCSADPDFSSSFSCVSNANKDTTGKYNWCNQNEEGITIYHKVDPNDDLSLKNWITDLDLACSRQGFTGPIALLGSL